MTTPQPPVSRTNIAPQEKQKQLSVVAAKSIYCADCLCGRYFETTSREWICPSCHRHIVLDWGQREKEAQPQPSQNDSNTSEAR
jgi:hypothetical protein